MNSVIMANTINVLAIIIITLTTQSRAQPSAVEVSHAIHHDVSLPLRNVPSKPISATRRVVPLRHTAPLKFSASMADPVVQKNVTISAKLPLPRLNFPGLGIDFPNFVLNGEPPDTNGAVGATQYVQWVNTAFAVFNKSRGALVLGPIAGNTLWSGFGGDCENRNDGDPIVQYDKAAHRWVFTQFSSVSTDPFANPADVTASQCVAISTTSDATGSYHRYSFSYGKAQLNDYAKLGIWPDAYYLSYNMFNFDPNTFAYIFAGAKVCAFDRAKMLAGAAASQQCFQQSTSVANLLPSDLDGSKPPPASSPNYFVNFGQFPDVLNIFRFHVNWVTPAKSKFTGPFTVNVALFTPACTGGGTCIPQPSSNSLDSLADRLMYRFAYRNFGTHESLVVNHAVRASTSVGVRWYELRSPSTKPIVFQQGTYAPDSKYRWMGSIAMDKVGNIAIGYSLSSESMFPSIGYTGRVPSDPLGTLRKEVLSTRGSGSQSGSSRWGDYTSMSIDPTDDCTFFYTNEYLKSTGDFIWSTKIISFKFPSCTASTG